MLAPVPRDARSSFAALQELYEDGPAQFCVLAELLSRAVRPQFGSVVVKFERGRIALVEEHRTHK